MSEIISKLHSDDVLALCGMLVGVVAILGGISVAVTKVVSSHYRRMQLDEMEATLKMQMIERGMSAAEITSVLAARMSGSPDFGTGPVTGLGVKMFRHEHQEA
jgi:hypothetical protein